jgi:hypothetical protein
MDDGESVSSGAHAGRAPRGIASARCRRADGSRERSRREATQATIVETPPRVGTRQSLALLPGTYSEDNRPVKGFSAGCLSPPHRSLLR